MDFAKTPILDIPMLPEVSLHWLAIDAVQPQTQDNPSIVPASSAYTDAMDSALPREVQVRDRGRISDS